MGVVNEVYEEKATKPRERQFQVVPVPGVFNRGRWKCWDYKDNGVGDHHQLAPEDRDIIDLSNKTDVIVVPAEETPVDSQLVTSASASSLLPSHESSTIVVTSIAYSSPQLSDPTSNMTSDVIDDAMLGVSSMPVLTTNLIDDQQPLSQQSNYITNLSPPQQQSRQSIATPATILSRQASSQTLTASVSPPPDVVIDAITTTTTTTTASITGSASGSNVAIDNKIEQAMDLVKTHLTYAVREEVEILRSTIVDLEAKVTRLENENALLRQYAPAEVVAQLPYLIAANQQQKQAQQNTMTPNEQ